MENGMQLTLPGFDPKMFQKPIVTVSDFHVRLSALLETDEALKMHEELYFLKSCGLLKSDTLKYFSQKMSQGYLTTGMESHLMSSSTQWQNWGILSNGKCLTADISESRRIEKECSLSDILETDVDEKYFLSQQTIQRLISYQDTKIL